MENKYEFEYENKEYPFLNVPKCIGSEEYEVTNYSIQIIKEKYPLYKGNNKYKFREWRKHRRQMSTAGAFLEHDDKFSIDIVADIITSNKFIATGINEQQNIDFKINNRIYHSIGNILPVCEGINHRWGGYDCCWVKFNVLKEYIEKKDGYDENSLKGVEEKIRNGNYLGHGITNQGCLRYWIYKNLPEVIWEEFVKQNYLQDFVNDKFDPIDLTTLLYKSSPEHKRRVRRIAPEEIDKLNRMIIKRGYRIWNEGRSLDDSGVDQIINSIKETL